MSFEIDSNIWSSKTASKQKELITASDLTKSEKEFLKKFDVSEYISIDSINNRFANKDLRNLIGKGYLKTAGYNEVYLIKKAEEIEDDKKYEETEDKKEENIERGFQIEEEHLPTFDKIKEDVAEDGKLDITPDEFVTDIEMDHIEGEGLGDEYYDEEIGLPAMEKRLENKKSNIIHLRKIQAMRTEEEKKRYIENITDDKDREKIYEIVYNEGWKDGFDEAKKNASLKTAKENRYKNTINPILTGTPNKEVTDRQIKELKSVISTLEKEPEMFEKEIKNLKMNLQYLENGVDGKGVEVTKEDTKKNKKEEKTASLKKYKIAGISGFVKISEDMYLHEVTGKKIGVNNLSEYIEDFKKIALTDPYHEILQKAETLVAQITNLCNKKNKELAMKIFQEKLKPELERLKNGTKYEKIAYQHLLSGSAVSEMYQLLKSA